jgi:hypothetical protein
MRIISNEKDEVETVVKSRKYNNCNSADMDSYFLLVSDRVET